MDYLDNLKATKHRTPRIANEVTLHRIAKHQQFLILEALQNERSKYTYDHSDKGQEKWDDLTRIIGVMIEAL